jgi:hypothetical protein
LGQAAALTDINQNPYQPYAGQQVAAFTPLQSQAMQGISGQQTAGQLTDASNIASQVGQMALQTPEQARGLQNAALGYGAQAAGAGAQYANMATSPGAIGAYMSPYMQNVVDLQKQEANRAYDITGAKTMGQGVAAGAFGGSRDALMRAENERNRNTTLANIQAQGSQSAYDKAMQSMQYGSNLGLQGLQTGLQGVQGAVGAGQYGLAGLGTAGTAASTLGALGQTQFGQEMAINQAQMQAGALQQAQEQRGMDIAYQQYQDSLNYPYKQLAFQSDMFRGLPLSQASQTIYQNTGAMAPQLLGAGIAAYGATNKAAKEGGMVKGYAAGGGVQVDPRALSSVSPASLPSKLSRLSDDQLMAYARTVRDPAAREEVQAEMTRRAEVRQSQQATQAQEAQGGIGQQPVMAAGGGIVALAGGSEEPVKEKTELQEFFASQRAEAERGDLENALLKRARQLDSFYGGALGSTQQRNEARTLIQDLQGAPIDALRSFRASGVTPKQQQVQNQYGADAPGRTNNAGVAEVVAAGNRDLLNADADSQIQGGVTPDNIGYAMAVTGENQEMQENQQQMQDADSQVQPRGGIAAIPAVVAGAAPAGGGITDVGTPVAGATSAVPPAGGGITDVGTPAGGAPRTGTTAPVNAMTPRTAGAGGHGATVGSTGAGIPVGVPGDPMNFATYRANVEDMAKLDPEDKATLANMQARAEKRLRRAEGQEKNVMNDAFVAGGLAMMGGLNLADGIRRAAEQGGKQYFSSQAEARKAIDKAEEAQDAFYQYRTALKQGNKKLANEMYGTFYKSYTDYIGKIQAAGITAGASRENAQATREATEAWRKDQIEQRGLDRDAMNQRHADNIAAREKEFKITMQDRGDTRVVTQMNYLDQRQRDILAERRQAEDSVYRKFQGRFEQLQMATPIGKPVPENVQRAKQALMDEYELEVKKRTAPMTKQYTDIVNQKGELMGISAPNGGFRVLSVK